MIAKDLLEESEILEMPKASAPGKPKGSPHLPDDKTETFGLGRIQLERKTLADLKNDATAPGARGAPSSLRGAAP